MVLYACAYLALVAGSIVVGLTVHQALATPDPAASYITCRSGTRLPYKTLGIRDPLTDSGHDNLLIDVSCRNLGGNTYTNVMRRGTSTTAWRYGLAVLAGGLVALELVKGTLVYLVTGRFPGFGALGPR